MIKEVGEKGTQNILDAISNKCKIIFPSTHVVYEGLNEVKKDIKEDDTTKPVLSYSKSKDLNEKQLKKFWKKLYNFKAWICLWLFNRLYENRYNAEFIFKNRISKWDA